MVPETHINAAFFFLNCLMKQIAIVMLRNRSTTMASLMLKSMLSHGLIISPKLLGVIGVVEIVGIAIIFLQIYYLNQFPKVLSKKLNE